MGHLDAVRAAVSAPGQTWADAVSRGPARTPRPRPELPWLRLQVHPRSYRAWGPRGWCGCTRGCPWEARLVAARTFQRSWGLEGSGGSRNVLCLDLGPGRRARANTVG